MAEIISRVNYLEHQLVQFKNIVARNSGYTDNNSFCAGNRINDNGTPKECLQDKIDSRRYKDSKDLLIMASADQKLSITGLQQCSNFKPPIEPGLTPKYEKGHKRNLFNTQKAKLKEILGSKRKELPKLSSLSPDHKTSRHETGQKYNTNNCDSNGTVNNLKRNYTSDYSWSEAVNVSLRKDIAQEVKRIRMEAEKEVNSPKEGQNDIKESSSSQIIIKREVNLSSNVNEPQRKVLSDYWKPTAELEWCKNLLLVGDGFWGSFLRFATVKNKVSRIEKVHFRLIEKKEEFIQAIYDDVRGKLLFALPPKAKMVCISIGAQDILNVVKSVSYTNDEFNEEYLPLGQELNDQKKVMLKGLAKQIKNMVKKLLSINKSVMLLVPYAKEHLEMFDEWQSIVKQTLNGLPFPVVRILNLADVMNSTLDEFQSPQEMFESWLPDEENSLSLSEYGSIRLFNALEKSIMADNQ